MCWLVLLNIYGTGCLVAGKSLGSYKKKKGLIKDCCYFGIESLLGQIVSLWSVELRFFAPSVPKMVNDICFTISRFQSFHSFSAAPKWSSSNLVWIEMQMFFFFPIE